MWVLSFSFKLLAEDLGSKNLFPAEFNFCMTKMLILMGWHAVYIYIYIITFLFLKICHVLQSVVCGTAELHWCRAIWRSWFLIRDCNQAGLEQRRKTADHSPFLIVMALCQVWNTTLSWLKYAEAALHPRLNMNYLQKWTVEYNRLHRQLQNNWISQLSFYLLYSRRTLTECLHRSDSDV